MGKITGLLAVFSLLIIIRCVSSNTTISSINMPLSGIKFEGVDDATTLKAEDDDDGDDDDAKSDLVSDFFDHIKEIFESEGPNVTYNIKHDFTLNKTPSSSPKLMRFLDTTLKTKQSTKFSSLFENATFISSTYRTTFTDSSKIIMTYKLEQSTRSSATDPVIQQRFYKKYQNNTTKPVTMPDFEEDGLMDSETSIGPISEDSEQNLKLIHKTSKANLSCILCDNVINKDCNDPKNKLLPLISCERTGDMCYSMQTPFGIIDRGCYNPLSNHSTYVCSCNLCNSIPIHDLPHTYTNKKEWLRNVQELSHERRLRKSIHSQMSCLHCEVNQTIDDVPDINCLEGKYRVLPSRPCETDEICGIRSIRSEGYIWRGCIKYPRYNYLWNFCNYDLCNFDPPTSLFDID